MVDLFLKNLFLCFLGPVLLYGVDTMAKDMLTNKRNQDLLDTLLEKPCVSSDNKHVIFFTRESRGSGIGASEYNLVIKNVLKDSVIFYKTLLSEIESDSLKLDSTSEKQLLKERFKTTISKINKFSWKPMLHQVLPDPPFFSDACYSKELRPQRFVVFGKLKLIYQEPWLKAINNKKIILKRPFKNWAVKKEWCEKPNPSWLKSISLSPDYTTLLVGIDFCGVDGCPEPPADFHVVSINQTQQ